MLQGGSLGACVFLGLLLHQEGGPDSCTVLQGVRTPLIHSERAGIETKGGTLNCRSFKAQINTAQTWLGPQLVELSLCFL